MKFEKPKSSIERVVGTSEEEEKKILKERAEIFSDQIFEELNSKEREKTSEEYEMIAIANDATNGLRREFGMEKFDIPAKNIHIVPKEKWPKTETAGGIFNSSAQAVAIQDEGASRLYSLSTITHELLHFKSYSALQMTSSDTPELRGYRSGLKTISRDGKQAYFTELNEAITEELTKRMLSRSIGALKENPIFAEEIKKTEAIIKKYPHARNMRGTSLFTSDTLHAETRLPEFKHLIDYVLGRRSPLIKTEAHSYKRQRRMLNSLIEKVFLKNKDKFKDEKEVFDVFARAYMTGNLLPMGRLIEETFGEGSFRRIAELDMSSGLNSREKKERAAGAT